jgi:ArsR family transcriptional regulator
MSPDNVRVSRFKVLADETRLRILEILLEEPQCVSDLVTRIKMEQSLVSHHLRILKEAQLVEGHRQGKKIYYKLSDDLRGDDINQHTLELGCCRVELQT